MLFARASCRSVPLLVADVAKFFKLPTILTTSFEDGPNVPLVPELKQMLPGAPFIPRPGQINAWDNEDFVKAVEQTGRGQFVIAGAASPTCASPSPRCPRSRPATTSSW